jgi:hypothetical protein
VKAVIRITDIDGSYDFSAPDRQVAVRYLDFVPFLDRAYKTPDVDGYAVCAVLADGSSKDIGRFEGTHEEMLRTGGLVTMAIPSDAGEDWRLSVDVIRAGSRAHLMLESEWDIALESERSLILGSGESAVIEARVYRHNQPMAGVTVTTVTQAQNRSPIVAFLLNNSR